MKIEKQQTLFALDCGATNWRLYRCVYQWDGAQAKIIGEPQASPLTSFIDRKLPAILFLDAAGCTLESFGEAAQQQLESELNRERIRDSFKPCIGSHLEANPLAHQIRYTHTQSMDYTRLLLQTIIEQIKLEKWRSGTFDEQVWFTFAYPIHWQYEHEGKILDEFRALVRSCLPEGFSQVRFVAEPEGAIFSLQRRGLLEQKSNKAITLIIDVGGSSSDIIAGEVNAANGNLNFLGRYGEPFGGTLYDAELAKFLADELQIPASALADDPTALLSLRMTAQRFKESLSRQLLSPGQNHITHQRIVTLVLRNGEIYRRKIKLDEELFEKVTSHLHTEFINLIERAVQKIAIDDNNIQQVVLVGGGAQLYTIMNYLRARFGEDRVILADNPDEVVVQGIGLEYEASFHEEEPSVIFPDESIVDLGFLDEVLPSLKWCLQCGEKDIPLDIGILSMGRDKDSDIFVDDIKASRNHAEVWVSVEKLEIADIGSTNGTFINGETIQAHRKTELQCGDVISIGKAKYIVKQITEGSGEI
ncbi:MAG: FHA domain-containing protein [Anaerolineaceae bacterium]|nr:FHA domain-containing protein [Anaerolineaceae bacterium]